MNPWLFADGVNSAPSLTAAANYKKELADTISCIVEREINGIYELTMTYPVDGVLYDDIGLRSLLYVSPDDTTDRQLFRIYRISKPLRGVVTINARHISYDLGGYVKLPFSASGLSATLSALTTSTYPSCPFTFTTTLSKSGSYETNIPYDIWSLMGGVDGSLIDKWHGLEYDFDNFTVNVTAGLGNNNGVVIEYGKNITQLLQEENSGTMITGICPYYYNETDGLVTISGAVIDGSVSWPFDIYKPVDLTDKFQSKPSAAQLQLAATAYLLESNIGNPKLTLDVDFVPLWQTLEYKNDARERVSLGDTVTVRFTKLGVDATARAVAYTYDCLKEKYRKITIGSAKADLAQVIRRMIGKTIYDNHEAWD